MTRRPCYAWNKKLEKEDENNQQTIAWTIIEKIVERYIYLQVYDVYCTVKQKAEVTIR